ncbi:MAG: hypothetical protein KBD46_02235 [Candidatus Levybacteria bacterium]|nr:hypothetical protein [Candidatus Levybacteria bacterium]
MDNASTGRVKDLLSKNDKIAILVGKNPSLDQMAGALALYIALGQGGKNVTIASPTESIVANSSLVGIDKVKTALSGEGGDLIVSFPYREGEIEKVSYTLENGYLNIVVKATEDGLSFEQQDVLFKRSGGLPGLAFIVGTARLSDLGSLFDADALKNTAIINIDNQNDNQGFGDIVLVSPQASSVSELIGSLLSSLQIEVDQDIAQNLLSGLSQATNNFQENNTSFLAFEMAAAYMKKGAKRMSVPLRPAADSGKSPFGPFTMPSPRPATGVRQQVAPPQQQREQRTQPVSARGERPWEQKQPVNNQFIQSTPRPTTQRGDQSQQPMQHMQQQQPVASSMPSQQPMQQQQPRPMQEVEHKEAKEEPETPPDWLSPKVYKSSTLI